MSVARSRLWMRQVRSLVNGAALNGPALVTQESGGLSIGGIVSCLSPWTNRWLAEGFEVTARECGESFAENSGPDEDRVAAIVARA